jgi:GTP-binding protein
MTFQVNDSPFAGSEGKHVTLRNIKERLERELSHNVALRVEQGDSPDRFIVSDRGKLHLSVLIENMRRGVSSLACRVLKSSRRKSTARCRSRTNCW